MLILYYNDKVEWHSVTQLPAREYVLQKRSFTVRRLTGLVASYSNVVCYTPMGVCHVTKFSNINLYSPFKMVETTTTKKEPKKTFTAN